MRSTWPVTLAVLLVTGCSNTIIGGIQGSGEMTSETRDVSGFDEIVLEGSGTVTVEVTGTESLTIEAEDNLMSRLTSDVEDGRLVLGVRGPIRATREIVYTITAATLEGIAIAGSGEVEVGDVTADTFTVEISGSGSVAVPFVETGDFVATVSGSGSIEAAGTTNGLDVEIPGSGTFSGEALEAATGTVTIAGSGNAVVNVSDKLDATVSGSGNIDYLGDPTVESTISGSGSIRSR